MFLQDSNAYGFLYVRHTHTLWNPHGFTRSRKAVVMTDFCFSVNNYEHVGEQFGLYSAGFAHLDPTQQIFAAALICVGCWMLSCLAVGQLFDYWLVVQSYLNCLLRCGLVSLTGITVGTFILWQHSRPSKSVSPNSKVLFKPLLLF